MLGPLYIRIISFLKSKGQTTRGKASIVLSAAFLLAAGIFVFAELGGYGVNGPATAPNSLDWGLVGYWDMEEGSGQTVYDKSGNGNNGIFGDTTAVESNDPTFGPGHDSAGENGSGVIYDGYDDYANAGTGSSLNVTGAITMSAWVKPAVSDGNIIRKVDTNLGYMMHLMSDQRVQIGINDFNSYLTTSNDAITLNSWNHIVSTVDSNGAAVIYVNGVSVMTGTLQVLNTAATNPLLIGGDSWNSGNYFNGSLDEIRLYKRALSADEVRLLYNQKKPILHLKMDEGAGADLYDESFNDHDAKIYNKINTAISASSNTLTDNDITWTTDEWAGREVSIVYGTGIGQTRNIASNTSDTLTVSANWTVTPDSTSRYVMTLDGSSVWTERESMPAVALANVGYAGIVQDWAPISGTGGFTLEAWVKTSTTTRQIIMAQRDPGAVVGEYMLEINNGGKVYYWDYDGAYGHNFYSNKVVSDNAWHHIVFTRSGTTGTIYIDGVLDNTSTGTAVSIASSLDFEVGADFRDASAYFNGSLDDVRVYSYARTADEVTADYNDGLAARFGSVNTLNQGLVGYWDMDEGSGQTVYDKSGAGNDATLGASSSVGSDDPAFMSGFSEGMALDFDGVDDRADAGNADALNGASAFSVSAWVKTDTLAGGDNNLRYITAQEGLGASNTAYILRMDTSVDMFEFYAGGTDYVQARATTPVVAGSWYHVVGTYDGGNVRIYVNGEEEKATAKTGATGSNTESLAIGHLFYDSASARHWDGSIDELRLYDRALSATEVAALFRYSPRDTPVLEWRLNDATGTNANDETTNNLDGTLGDGTPSYVPTWTTGKFSGGLLFDGTDDIVSAGDPASGILDFGSKDFTAEAWIKVASPQAYDAIVGKRANVSGSEQGWSLKLKAGVVNVYMGDGTEGNCTGADGYNFSTSIADGNWHYVTLSRDGNDVIVSIDGTLLTKQTMTTCGSISNTDNFRIGKIGEGFNGYMDDIRIYDYIRSAQEIAMEYEGWHEDYTAATYGARLGSSSYDLSSGLIGLWDMEEGSGQAITDNTGKMGNGILGASSSAGSDDPVFVVGHGNRGTGGSALDFDGINDYVSITANDNEAITNAISFTAWVKPEAINPVSDTPDYGVSYIANYQDTNVGLRFTGDAKFGFMTSGSTEVFLDSSDTYALNQYYFVAGTYDGTNMNLYVNGANKGTTGQTGNLNLYSSIMIGAGCTPIIRHFNGAIDEVRMYNRALSVDEIQMLYDMRKPVLEYRFNEGSGVTVYDDSLNDNDGSLGGGTADYMPSWVQGRSGSALSFDGNDLISASDSSSLDVSGHLTVEAWVYPTELYTETSILSKGGTASCANYDLYIYNGTLALLSSASCNWSYAGSNSVVTTGAWQHIAATYDGANVNYYINGVLTDSKAWAGIGTVNAETLEIGHQQATAEGDFYGKMDNVRIYNYDRSASEILVDYNDGLAAHLR